MASISSTFLGRIGCTALEHGVTNDGQAIYSERTRWLRCWYVSLLDSLDTNCFCFWPSNHKSNVQDVVDITNSAPPDSSPAVVRLVGHCSRDYIARRCGRDLASPHSLLIRQVQAGRVRASHLDLPTRTTTRSPTAVAGGYTLELRIETSNPEL